MSARSSDLDAQETQSTTTSDDGFWQLGRPRSDSDPERPPSDSDYSLFRPRSASGDLLVLDERWLRSAQQELTLIPTGWRDALPSILSAATIPSFKSTSANVQFSSV